MPWFNVDDGFANSKPVMRIPRRWRAAAIGLWTLTGSWSAKELTDGFIPDAVVEEYGGTPKLIELLIAAELWEPAESGVQFRNWSKWQKTKQQVTEFRAAEAERKRKQRERKTAPTEQGEREVSQSRPVGVPPGHPLGHQRASGLPIPTPLPTPSPLVETLGGEVTNATRERGPNDPPPPHCSEHMPLGTSGPCRACGDAKAERREWSEQRNRDAAAARRVELEQAAADRAIEIANCQIPCDDDGYRNGVVCDHVDRAGVAANGRAMVAAALAKSGAA